jgi:hypothetical protein
VSRKSESFDALPLRQELEALVHHYLHLHNELERTKPESSTRRKLEDRLLDVRGRIDRLLEQWVDDPEVREGWRAHLHGDGPAPDEPRAVPPLLFRGENEARSVAEVRGPLDELRLYVDGSLLERVEARRDLSSTVPGLVFRIDGFAFRETFAADREALEALGEFAQEGGEPPWDYVSDLLADGTIGVHLDVTPRGRRALATAELG